MNIDLKWSDQSSSRTLERAEILDIYSSSSWLRHIHKTFNANPQLGYCTIDFISYIRFHKTVANWPAFTYSKLTLETLEQGVKYVQS